LLENNRLVSEKSQKKPSINVGKSGEISDQVKSPMSEVCEETKPVVPSGNAWQWIKY